MARIRFKGLEAYELKLGKLRSGTREIAAKAIRAAAGIVADPIRENIRNLPIDEGYGTRENPTHGVKQVQKDGLLDGFGITPLRDDNGYYNVKIGFDRYNDLKTKGHPAGQPNQMVARAVESGTIFSDKIPFVRPAVNASKGKAEAKMAKVIDEEIKKIMD